MLDFLQNQWVVGIGGGIISGIIVFFITKWLFQRKDNSKYLEQIANANLDIIRTLKPYIAEKGLPEKTIMPRGWHHDKWNHCKMIGIECLPTTTYTVINGKDRFFFGPLARRKN